LTGKLVFAIPAVMGGCYYGLALVAALLRRRTAVDAEQEFPPVSVLKPVHGAGDRLYEAVASHVTQDYPEAFEVLLGVRKSDTAALEEIARVQAAFPEAPIRVVAVCTKMHNAKVGSLADMAAAARYPVLVINDSDICVEPDYLRKVATPLGDRTIGLVTALYRAVGQSFPARMEALGVATEFAPSVLVARLLGVAEFALGSTMVVRHEDVARIGGFLAIGDYLADDYQLGLHITRLGLHVAFADTVVETTLGAGGWAEVWRHQVRWSRTIRVSRPSGYYGYVVTQATFWVLVAAAAGYWEIAAATLGIRMLAGLAASGAVLKDRAATARFWLMPLRDLFGFAVWLAASVGNTVEWRGMRLRLTRDGRIREV
jgi:ceramide glucosyltransferase